MCGRISHTTQNWSLAGSFFFLFQSSSSHSHIFTQVLSGCFVYRYHHVFYLIRGIKVAELWEKEKVIEKDVGQPWERKKSHPSLSAFILLSKTFQNIWSGNWKHLPVCACVCYVMPQEMLPEDKHWSHWCLFSVYFISPNVHTITHTHTLGGCLLAYTP